METEIMEPENNVGGNIKQLRDILGISQNQLAMQSGISANTLRKVESQKTVDDKMLDKIAAGMGVPAELIKRYNHKDTVNYIVSNNTFDAKEQSDVMIGGQNEHNDNRVFNPVEKLTEVYERLLEEQKKNMQGEIDELRRKLGE